MPVVVDATTKDNVCTLTVAGRIDSNNAGDFEREAMAALDAAEGATPVIDMADLAYISSAGLRVIMRIMKRSGGTLRLTNVGPEVFDVLEMTGFADMLDVERKLREISVEGCELIGKGGNGAVYRIDEDTIVKVYKPWMGREDIQRERDFARAAFVSGVPSVIAYDVVQVGDCLGVVFEMLKSDTLGHIMRDDVEHLDDYVDRYVALVRELHATQGSPEVFETIQDVWRRRLPKLAEWCSEDEIALLSSLVDEIPERNTLIHNDLHPGNIMVQDGELVIIDMPEVTRGPAFLDLVSIYRDMVSGPKAKDASNLEGSVGMPKDLIARVGEMFFERYANTTDPDKLQALMQRLGLIYALNVVVYTGAGSESARKFAPMIMDNLLRGIVIPNEQAIRAILRSL